MGRRGILIYLRPTHFLLHTLQLITTFHWPFQSPWQPTINYAITFYLDNYTYSFGGVLKQTGLLKLGWGEILGSLVVNGGCGLGRNGTP